jgi:hypothetical protein
MPVHSNPVALAVILVLGDYGQNTFKFGFRKDFGL